MKPDEQYKQIKIKALLEAIENTIEDLRELVEDLKNEQ